ncbi:MAG TPA: c-type cytochrome, partial [Candidatus Binatia bacterium]|nr:c-type cytochrome [Candidatus Binatia bacterium]
MNKVAVSAAVLIGMALVSRATAWPQDQAEGRKLYASYCSTCHGEKGRGDGMAAKSLPAKPADHTNGAVMNQLNDKFLVEVIAKGGGAVGKS